MGWTQLIVLFLSLIGVPSLCQTNVGCERTCGSLDVPYPFGLGRDTKCYRDVKFKLFCNHTYNPPRLFLGKLRIQNISLEGQLTITLGIAYECYNKSDGFDVGFPRWVRLIQGYSFSNTRNKFTAIGCATSAYISDYSEKNFQSGCASFCSDITSVTDGSCSGIGCCQTSIPKDVKYLNLTIDTYYHNDTNVLNFNPCSYAFLAEDAWFEFHVSDLHNFIQGRGLNFSGYPSVPAVVDWAIGNTTCSEAQKDTKNYACGKNTDCIDSKNGPGYRCHCTKGYEGNPYEQDGCQDIDECSDTSANGPPCVTRCTNKPGSYTCSACPLGQRGDGKSTGSGCTVKILYPLLGTGIGSLFLLFAISSIFWSLQKRKLVKMKEKFFYQNGGMLLHQKLSSNEHAVEATKIFSSEELKKATDNYHESRILGQGGYGTVYKGILRDERIVAIKKSKIVDKAQIEQFINEVLILSQINHSRNVVKLLGCCLETEVPLLVYEFINNGTLFHHIMDERCKYSISWSNRLRIAAETSGAIAYLHSSASQPIIHRDIKSANILLDDHYTAKVADFGASRLIASLDQNQLSTLVQGTMGYLDPEYMHTSLLTDKSDVYSFGVVLVELLTGRKALCFQKPEAERNLAMFFVSSLKENRLFEILEYNVANEGNSEQLREVANLARRCLRLNGEERPTMKEVAMELEGIRISSTHAWADQQNHEERDCLLGEPVGSHDDNSMKDQLMHSLHIGR